MPILISNSWGTKFNDLNFYKKKFTQFEVLVSSLFSITPNGCDQLCYALPAQCVCCVNIDVISICLSNSILTFTFDVWLSNCARQALSNFFSSLQFSVLPDFSTFSRFPGDPYKYIINVFLQYFPLLINLWLQQVAADRQLDRHMGGSVSIWLFLVWQLISSVNFYFMAFYLIFIFILLSLSRSVHLTIP